MAVSGFVVQIAESAFSASPDSMASTGRLRNNGKTSDSRITVQGARLPEAVLKYSNR